jgi:hypothetical protein
MKKNTDRQASKSKAKVATKPKINSAKNKTVVEPEEFEENRSMNIRMKPQPLKQAGKKPGKKK